MKKSRFEQMQAQLLVHLEPELGQRAAAAMETEYQSLCKAYEDRPKSLYSHTHNNIFPVVAAFRALTAQGMDRSLAAELARDAFLELMETPASMIRKMMKVPGLYKLMPWLWKTMMPRLFSEDAGFRFRFYDRGSSQVKFDMLACPYYQICQELDCTELAPIFCASDDVCYGQMHPRLIWNRTKTLARGGDVCDFDLYIGKK